MLQNTLLYGLIIAAIIAAITLFIPVELYDGYAIMGDGLKIEEKLSLSYFFNKSSFLADYKDQGVVDIALKPIGFILVFIVNIGLPFLLGYRIAVAKSQENS
jgi:hypothetical protein